MSRKITESTAEQCVWFLMDSCDAHAEAKGAVIAAENAIKRAKAEVYLETSGTVAERDAKVTLNSQVRDAEEEHREAVMAELALRDKRSASEVAIEMWRSLNAAHRQTDRSAR